MSRKVGHAINPGGEGMASFKRLMYSQSIHSGLCSALLLPLQPGSAQCNLTEPTLNMSTLNISSCFLEVCVGEGTGSVSNALVTTTSFINNPTLWLRTSLGEIAMSSWPFGGETAGIGMRCLIRQPSRIYVFHFSNIQLPIGRLEDSSHDGLYNRQSLTLTKYKPT